MKRLQTILLIVPVILAAPKSLFDQAAGNIIPELVAERRVDGHGMSNEDPGIL